MSRMQIISSVLGVGLCLSLLGMASPAGSSPAEGEPEALTLDELGLSDIEIDLSTDWRVEQQADGGAFIVFGPGTSELAFKEDTIAFAGTAPVGGAITPKVAANWTCVSETPAQPILSGNYLESYVGVSCTNRPGKVRMEHWFDRSWGVSWLQFTQNHRYTSWTSAQTQGANIYARCAKGEGTYWYRAKMKISVTEGSIQAGTAYSADSQWNCGSKAITG